ncbi:YfhE family protein [Bacillus shivajii]|nr:YfhE family protein [Bacillus shivajii]UCZ53491.1 YfhE family protein [Bacillus shivajii]
MEKTQRLPHKHMNEKHNGLSTAQEVIYSKDFKKADRAAEAVMAKSND